MSVPAYLLALGCIFAVNLMPAFGPPTWAVIVFFRVTGELDLVPLVLGGAVAAASGRLALAHGARAFRGRLRPERLEQLGAAQAVLTADRRRTFGGLALFAVSPVPSAQLFVAAGLLAVPLVPLTAAFFAGRLVSYSLYAGGATLAAESLPDTFAGVFGSPVGIGLQVLMLLALVALVRVDWIALLGRRRSSPHRVCDDARMTGAPVAASVGGMEPTAPRILVAYASKNGSTAEIAEVVADVLRDAGADVDCRDARQVRALDGYDAVVIGSAVYMRRWRREARHLLSRHRHELAARPFWIFSSGPVGAEPDAGWSEPQRLIAEAERLGVRDHAVFGGRVPRDPSGFIEKAMARDTPPEFADLRDWDEIREWAAGIAAAVSAARRGRKTSTA